MLVCIVDDGSVFTAHFVRIVTHGVVLVAQLQLALDNPIIIRGNSEQYRCKNTEKESENENGK